MPGVEVWLLRLRKIDPNAKAFVGNPYEATPIRASSNIQGEAIFTGVPPGTYGVQVPSFDQEPRSLGNFELKAGSNLRKQVRAVPHAVVQGTITNDQGLPLSGAGVQLLKYQIANTTRPGLMSIASARTDSQGRYRLESRQPGNYYVQARAGIAAPPLYYPGTSDFSKAQRVAATTGNQVDGIDLRISTTAPPLHISGQVEGFEGRALRIWAWRYSLNSPEQQEGIPSFLSADGRFDIAGVIPGHYYVTAESWPLPEDIRDYAFGSAQVIVENRDIAGVRLRITSPKELRGVVRVEPGLAMPSNVELESWGPPFNSTAGGNAKVDPASGAFALPRVFGREYSLNVSGPRGGYVKSAYLGLRDVTGQIFNPGDGDETLTIEIAVGRATLAGVVLSGAAITKDSAAMLVPTGAMSHRRDLLRTVSINPQGEFQFNSLAPGTYKVLAWEQYDRFSMDSPEFLALFPGDIVEIPEGKNQNISVKLISTQAIEQAKLKF